MALETTYETVTTVVTFLEDIDVEFISQVPKGANWTPIHHIDKTATPEDGMPGQIIESIILPDTQEWEELIANPEFAWLADMTVSKTVKYGGCTKYAQLDKDVFTPDSLSADKLGDTGGLVVWGDVKPEHKTVVAKAVVWAGKQPVAKASPLQQIIPDGYGPTVGNLISEELWRFQDIMWGALNQNAANPAKRTQIVMGALSNFWDFMQGILPTIGTQTVAKVEKSVESAGVDEPAFLDIEPDAHVIELDE